MATKMLLADCFQFGPKHFKSWWSQACKNLGVEGLGLYGGIKINIINANQKE
jgi:hypothetical protein